jgi:hypothetical protein
VCLSVCVSKEIARDCDRECAEKVQKSWRKGELTLICPLAKSITYTQSITCTYTHKLTLIVPLAKSIRTVRDTTRSSGHTLDTSCNCMSTGINSMLQLHEHRHQFNAPRCQKIVDLRKTIKLRGEEEEEEECECVYS